MENILPTAGYHRVCGPGGQCCHHLLVLEEEEHLPPADDDAGGVRLGLHHQQRLHIQPPQNIQEVRVCGMYANHRSLTYFRHQRCFSRKSK